MVKKRKVRSKDEREQEKQRIVKELDDLKQRCIDEAPARGYAPPAHQLAAFRTLPLSSPTLLGLESAKPTPYTTMTAIQNACIPHALAGRDILGAAKTGSGKTLAFVVPVLEALYKHRFSPMDGPGALILSPTRELAVQIFEVLRTVGREHKFSVGLLIGGKKDFYGEQQKVGTTNILIATPGRILQHLEQTPYFDVSSLKILVLDEADRILDMGFRDQLIRILDYVPKEGRQTLLFSATQTRDISHLATLSLHRPEYLGVHDKEKTSTPENLQQSYVVVPLEHKLSAVYSFIMSHLKCKSIVFLATCSQVRFAWKLFKPMRLSIPIMALHGSLVQIKRTQIYYEFSRREHAILFATDICARGLDFPNVDWVVQVDAPEDRDMYIHRAGRTARYRAGGKSLLMLTPAEEKNGFVDRFLNDESSSAKLPLKKLSVNPTKTVLVTERAASAVAADADLQHLAKKSFKSYVRSIYFMPRKDIFDVKELPLDEFAKSLGLPSTPHLRFLNDAAKSRDEYRERKNVNHKLQRLKDQIKAEKLARKLRKMGKSDEEIEAALAKTRTTTSNSNDDSALKSTRSEKDSNMNEDDDDDNDDDEILVSKGEIKWNDAEQLSINEINMPRKPKKIRIDGPNGPNKKIVFTEDGVPEDSEQDDIIESRYYGDRTTTTMLAAKEESNHDTLEKSTGDYVEKVRQRLIQNSEQDRLTEKERVKEKRKKRRLKEKGEQEENGNDVGFTVTLKSSFDEDEEAEDHPDAKQEYAASPPDVGASSSSDDSSTTSSGTSSSDEDEQDIEAQEALALSLIRGHAG